MNEQDPFCDYFSECSCGLNSIHAWCHAPWHVGNGLDSETESLSPVLFVRTAMVMVFSLWNKTVVKIQGQQISQV